MKMSLRICPTLLFADKNRKLTDSSNFCYEDLAPRSEVTMSFPYCTEKEVAIIIRSMREGGGLHDIPVRFMKLCIDHV